ncbi:MAG: condensation domain-containing protein, partial [Betaproteobacteria bacterium]
MSIKNDGSQFASSKGVPLSIAQQEVWREHAISPGSAVHTVGAVTRLDGKLDPVLFETALAMLWDRHDALRLTPVLLNGAVEPVLVEAERPARMMNFHDFSGHRDPSEFAEELLKELGRQVISLDGSETFRFDLIRLAPDKHIWSMCYHHINMDAWANGIVVRDIAEAYTELENGRKWEPAPCVSYADAIAGDARFSKSDRFLRNQEYWFETHQNLPDRYSETSNDVLSSGSLSSTLLRRISLDRSLIDRLMIVANEHNTTIARLFIAAIIILLHARSNAKDVVFGMPVLNRPTAREKATLGLFSLVVAPRVEILPDDELGPFLAKLDKAIRSALRHYRFPLSEISRHLGLASKGILQLFDVSVSY